MNFYWDGTTFYVVTAKARVKYKNIKCDPRINITVDDGLDHELANVYPYQLMARLAFYLKGAQRGKKQWLGKMQQAGQTLDPLSPTTIYMYMPSHLKKRRVVNIRKGVENAKTSTCDHRTQ